MTNIVTKNTEKYRLNVEMDVRETSTFFSTNIIWIETWITWMSFLLILSQDTLSVCWRQSFSVRTEFLVSLFLFLTVIRRDISLIPNRNLMAAGCLGKERKRQSHSHISIKLLMTSIVYYIFPFRDICILISALAKNMGIWRWLFRVQHL